MEETQQPAGGNNTDGLDGGRPTVPDIPEVLTEAGNCEQDEIF